MDRKALLLVVLLNQASATAQTELIRTTAGSSFQAQAILPTFDVPAGVTLVSRTFVLSATADMSDMLSLTLEVPYVQGRSETSSPLSESSDSKSFGGNILLGVLIGAPTQTVRGEIGFRLRAVDKGNGFHPFWAMMGDAPNVDRYLPGESALSSIGAGLKIRSGFPGAVSVIATMAPTIWMADEGDQWLVFKYGIGIARDIAIANIAVGINGVVKMSQEPWWWGHKDAVHHLQAEANFNLGRIRPGFVLRYPLDEELKMTKSTVGVYVGVVL